MSHRMRWLLFFVIFSSMASLSFCYFESRIRPNFEVLCKSQTALFGNKLINNCVVETLNDYKSSDKTTTVTDGMFSLIEKDKDGNVQSFRTNTATLNRYSAQVETKIYNALTDIKASTISIPLGNVLTDSVLFSNTGPNLKVRIKPVGFADIEYESHFTNAGINEVKHEVILKVKLTLVAYMLPGVSTRVTVHSDVPIDQTILMGNVPNFYGSLSGGVIAK